MPQSAPAHVLAEEVPVAAAPRRLTELALLNGTHSARTRYALKSSFRTLNGATGSSTYGVRFQRGGNQQPASASSTQRLSEAAAPLSLDAPGMPYWMSTEPDGVLLPRSTTHATYTAIPNQSHSLDRELFHMYYQRDLQDSPSLRSTTDFSSTTDSVGSSFGGSNHGSFASSRSLGSSFSESRLKRLPLTSNHQPQLFFRVPDRPQAHPHLFRNSATLRQEECVRSMSRSGTSTGGELLPIVGENGALSPTRSALLQQQQAAEASAMSGRYASPLPPSISTAAAPPYFRRDNDESLHVKLNRAGVTQSSPPRPTTSDGLPSRPTTGTSMGADGRPASLFRPYTSHTHSATKVGRDIGEGRNFAAPQALPMVRAHMQQQRAEFDSEQASPSQQQEQSSFQSHMAQARARWEAEKQKAMM